MDEGPRVATRILLDGTPALDMPVRMVTLPYTDGLLFAAKT
jgi:hypothetical protein